MAKRIDRQAILTRKTPVNIVAVFDEVAIRRAIGGPEVMRGQYRRLIEVDDLHNLTLHIIPSSAGAYAGIMGAFFILGFDDAPDLVYTEGHVGGQITEHRPTVQEYRLRYDLIKGAAMSADESRKLLRAALEFE